jgi:hypothetical protein
MITELLRSGPLPFLSATLVGITAELLVSRPIPRRYSRLRCLVAFAASVFTFALVLHFFGISAVGLFASAGGLLTLLIVVAILSIVALLL